MIEKIKKLLYINLAIKFVVDKTIQKKETNRSLKKYILIDESDKKYILEIANTKIEKFYLQRTIEFQKKFNELEHDFLLNIPIFHQIGNKFSFALYEYFENITFIKDNKPLELLSQFYIDNSVEIELTSENIEKILLNFISAWPEKYHTLIKRQSEFLTYKEELQKYKNIKVAVEHGDFTSNNILLIEKKIYLMDFEFARDFQPIGFDKFDYLVSIKKNNESKILHQLKYQLIEKINQKIDNDDIYIEIYNSFDNQILKENWERLYQKGFNYNLSLIWCQTWIKYFKKPNQELFIFTIWNDDKLDFLAPLYQEKQILYLVGTNPDLYDSFGFLYRNVKYIRQLYNFIFINNYQISFNYLDASSFESKELIKYLYQNNIVYSSDIIDTKPKIGLENYIPKKREKDDVKRCLNRAIKRYDMFLKFNFTIDKTDKVLNEFINIHIEKWEGGPFKDIPKFQEFIKDISRSDLVIISKLSLLDNTIAYHLAYKDSNNILNSAIPSYSNKYNDLSPGKVLLYELLGESKKNDYIIFDFGRGAEEYKYWFSKESSILFHLQTINRKKFFPKVQFLCNKIFNRLNRGL